jgi:excinuclease ABC subunit C
MTLIKKHRPHYNVRLKDDKKYPYVKVHWGDDFPKVTVTRNMQSDGGRYFGPYTSVWAVHKTLDVLRRIFPYLTCDRVITGQDERACLYYDIKLCNAPCIGKVTKNEYRAMIDDLCGFLNGRTEPVVARIREQMMTASDNLEFERAAQYRDQIRAIASLGEQKVVSPDYVDSDVIAMARNEREACVQVFFVRGGKLIGREYFMMEGADDVPDNEVMSDFIQQFYDQSANVPPQVLLPHDVEETQIITQWLRSKRSGETVELLVPREGKQKDLVAMAAENAADTLSTLTAQWQADKHKQTTALAEIQHALGMAEPPNRIECYDISTTQGTAITASMVVFELGVPNKKHYRRFNIRSVLGQDDFASMEEALSRRFKRYVGAQEILHAKEKGPTKKPDESFSRVPDLIIIDGGKGQLSRAVKVLEEFDLLDKLHVVGLAKRHEEIFVPGKSRSIMLKRKSEGLYMVQRIRDEAHRFAITGHRRRRDKLGLASQLDSIPGVGPTRRKNLLKTFGSIDKIRAASLDELTNVPGIPQSVAENIKAHLA